MHVFVYMLASLLCTAAVSTLRVAISLPESIIRSALKSCNLHQATAGGVTFYEGSIYHRRRKPVENTFTYPVRMALIDLDHPPSWWDKQSSEFLSAQQARQLASTKGSVRLLANPPTAGYTENPIAVYYCYTEQNCLEICIAVVQNTPWGATVTFAFRPDGETVPKALHVSPFMDMQNKWHLKASSPGLRLSVIVSVSHPKHGDYFLASLQLKVAASPGARSEEAGLRKLMKYGYQPQRAAILIYWQAMKLLFKGVPFYSPPDNTFKEVAEAAAASHPKLTTGCPYVWHGARSFPWNVDQ